jgi:hypothetical protein
MSLAEAELRKIDADGIACEVFSALNMLDVYEIGRNSGRTRYGYVEPYEAAHTMAEYAIKPCVREIAK